MSYQVTLTDAPTRDFNGVTIRKAMLPNGDYIDLKAFAADVNDTKRAYLRTLQTAQTVTVEATLSMNGKYRQLVL